MPRSARRRGAAIAITAVLASVLGGLVGVSPANASTEGSSSATLSGGLDPLGVNTAAWDGNFLDASIASSMKAASIGLTRYPGGSWADQYMYSTNTVNGSAQSMDFSQYANQVSSAGGQRFVTVNYGTDTAATAGAWAKASTSPGMGVALWEIGNEQYGTWEDDNHASPHTPSSYASNAVAYMQAIKDNAGSGAPVCMDYAPDPSLAAGAGVADWQSWDDTVLGQDAAYINCADLHWYPFNGTPSETTDQILATVDNIPAQADEVRTALATYDPSAWYVVGEENISNAPSAWNNEPVGALFSAATALEWLSYGAQSVDWWDAHNFGTSSADLGMWSSGGSGEPSIDTPMPPYYGFELAALLAHHGATVSTLDMSAANVYAWTSTASGSPVMLVNADPSSTPSISCASLGKSGTVTTYTYDNASPRIVEGSADCSGTTTLPAESVVVLSGGSAATTTTTAPSTTTTAPTTTVPSTTTTAGGGAAYDNTGTSADSDVSAANFDGYKDSYSATALADAGVSPGSVVPADGARFTWPDVPAGSPDNWQASGQQVGVSVPAGSSSLGVLGASTNGATSGTLTVHYSDGTSSSATLGFPDWCSGGQGAAVTTTYRNTPSGAQSIDCYVYASTVPIDASKSVVSVTLPSVSGTAQMHVFAFAGTAAGGTTTTTTQPTTTTTAQSTTTTTAATTTTTAAAGGGACKAAYSVAWSSPTATPPQYGVAVTVTNTASTTKNGWTVKFDFASGQSVVAGSAYNADVAQSGSSVTATPVGWDTSLNPGSEITFGFTADYNAASTAISGLTCS